jgi:hypothetical protein
MTRPPTDDQIIQKLYELLETRSKRDMSKYDKPKALTRIKIPGNLAFFLDDLFDLAASEYDLSKEEALAETISLGMVAWYRRLDEKTKTKLDLVVPESKKMQDLQKALALAKSKENTLRADLKSKNAELEKVLDEQGAARTHIASLESKLKKESQPSTPQSSVGNSTPSMLYEETPAYTPMTSHSFGANGNSSKPKAQNNNPPAGRKRRRRRRRV